MRDVDCIASLGPVPSTLLRHATKNALGGALSRDINVCFVELGSFRQGPLA